MRAAPLYGMKSLRAAEDDDSFSIDLRGNRKLSSVCIDTVDG